MPYRREQFVNGEIYHIVVRSIDDNLLFKDIDDYYRGIFSIYEFNNFNPVEIIKRRQEIRTAKKTFQKQIIKGERVSSVLPDNRDLLVEVLLFCLMPNHFHLLIDQVGDMPISNLMLKLCTSYAKYINQKHKRVGHIFQDQFKAVLIEDDPQLMWTSAYIHMNPVKDKIVKNPRDYEWSSYNDYAFDRNLPIVTKELLIGTFGSQKDFIEQTLIYDVKGAL